MSDSNFPTELLTSDLVPLPHESVFSMFARLLRANMLAPRKAHRLLCTHTNPTLAHFLSFERSRYRARSRVKGASDRLAMLTGWSPTATYPVELAMLDGFHGVWFDNKLALCPECIACRYHSHWHQLLGLARCPWHQVPIERSCRYCGTPFGPYAATEAVLRNPYSCHKCEAAYHPSACSLETGALWKNPEIIDQAFSAQRRWARRTAATLRHHAVWYRWSEHALEQWWSAEESMRAMAGLLSDPAPGCTLPSRPVTYYVWPLRLSTERKDGEMLYASAWKHHRTLPPYVAALQDLRTWILDTCQLSQTDLSPPIFKNNEICIGDWPAAALAYMLLRLTWESVETWSPVVEVDVRQFIESSYVQRCWSVVYDPRTTRALTFATFAALYWMIKQASGPTVPRYRADDRITTAYLGMAGEQLFGAVWFPTIPGLLEQEAADPAYLDLAQLRTVTMAAVVEQKPIHIPT